MRRESKAGGGDHHQGVSAPRVIAARTSEDAQPLPGDPHLTTKSNDSTVTDALWPLVTVLGDIARRVSRHASEAAVATTQGDHSDDEGWEESVG